MSSNKEFIFSFVCFFEKHFVDLQVVSINLTVWKRAQFTFWTKYFFIITLLIGISAITNTTYDFNNVLVNIHISYIHISVAKVSKYNTFWGDYISKNVASKTL